MLSFYRKKFYFIRKSFDACPINFRKPALARNSIIMRIGTLEALLSE
jgi:hypothetical protein